MNIVIDKSVHPDDYILAARVAKSAMKALERGDPFTHNSRVCQFEGETRMWFAVKRKASVLIFTS